MLKQLAKSSSPCFGRISRVPHNPHQYRGKESRKAFSAEICVATSCKAKAIEFIVHDPREAKLQGEP